MAKEDFCFTYYDGDAARDMAHMNRLERGGYSDIIISQRKFGHLSLDQVKKILGKDFVEIWPAIELIMNVDADGKFFIEWLETSIMQMRAHSKKQSENKKGKTKHNPEQNQTISKQEPNSNQTKPLEDGDVNEDGFEYEFQKGESNEKAHTVTVEVPRGTSELIEKVSKYFSVTQDVMNPDYDLVSDFVETIFHRNQLEKLLLVFDSYVAYKGRSQEQTHGIISWIGTKDNHYQDGAWIKTDWQQKNKNYHEQQTSKGTNRTTSAQVSGTVYDRGGGF